MRCGARIEARLGTDGRCVAGRLSRTLLQEIDGCFFAAGSGDAPAGRAHAAGGFAADMLSRLGSREGKRDLRSHNGDGAGAKQPASVAPRLSGTAVIFGDSGLLAAALRRRFSSVVAVEVPDVHDGRSAAVVDTPPLEVGAPLLVRCEAARWALRDRSAVAAVVGYGLQDEQQARLVLRECWRVLEAYGWLFWITPKWLRLAGELRKTPYAGDKRWIRMSSARALREARFANCARFAPMAWSGGEASERGAWLWGAARRVVPSVEVVSTMKTFSMPHRGSLLRSPRYSWVRRFVARPSTALGWRG